MLYSLKVVAYSLGRLKGDNNERAYSSNQLHHHVDSASAFIELTKAGMGAGIGSELMLKDAIQNGELY